MIVPAGCRLLIALWSSQPAAITMWGMSRVRRFGLRREWTGPWPWLLTFGVIALFVAITGQAFKGAGIEVAGLTDVRTRVLLAVFALLVGTLALTEGRELNAAAPSAAAGRPATERERVRELQRLLGLNDHDVDGLWGPITRNRCIQQRVGSPSHVSSRARSGLAGNRNRQLVAWIQQQLNRKYDASLSVDGIPGHATHKAVVNLLGEADGVVGPRGYRTLALD
jgi:hypothetical protein